MPSSLRQRLKTALDEADAKAKALTDAEINARLGPATRTAFAMGERIENQIVRVSNNAVPAAITTLGLMVAGYFAGSALIGIATASPLVKVFVAAVMGAAMYGTMMRARRNGTDVGYLCALLTMLAISAGSGGSAEVLQISAIVFIAGVWSGFSPLGKNKDVLDEETSPQ